MEYKYGCEKHSGISISKNEVCPECAKIVPSAEGLALELRMKEAGWRLLGDYGNPCYVDPANIWYSFPLDIKDGRVPNGAGSPQYAYKDGGHTVSLNLLKEFIKQKFTDIKLAEKWIVGHSLLNKMEEAGWEKLSDGSNPCYSGSPQRFDWYVYPLDVKEEHRVPAAFGSPQYAYKDGGMTINILQLETIIDYGLRGQVANDYIGRENEQHLGARERLLKEAIKSLIRAKILIGSISEYDKDTTGGDNLRSYADDCINNAWSYIETNIKRIKEFEDDI